MQGKVSIVPLDRPDMDGFVVAFDGDAVRRGTEPRLNSVLRSRSGCPLPHAVRPIEKPGHCRDQCASGCSRNALP